MKVVKAKSDELLIRTRAKGLFAAAVSHFKTLSRAILYLDTVITFKFLLSSCRVFLFLPAFCHKNVPRLLHNHQYTFHGRRFHPSFLLFPLSKGPYFTQKISDFSRKISYVFWKNFPRFSENLQRFSQNIGLFLKPKGVSRRHANGTQTATGLHDDRKIPQKKKLLLGHQ